MANALYGFGREAFLSGTFNWNTAMVKVAIMSSSYSPSINTERYWSQITGSGGVNIINTTVALTGSTSTLGVADANDVTFTAVTSSLNALGIVTYIVLYQDTGLNQTSPLIAMIDTATGLPVTPNGGDITIQWDNGANRIFKL